MNLECGYILSEDIKFLKDAFYTVGLLQIKESVEGNVLYVSVDTKENKNMVEDNVARFLMKNLIKYFKQFARAFYYNCFYVTPIISVLNRNETLVIAYKFSPRKNDEKTGRFVFLDLIKALNYAVDEARVEYCFFIDRDYEHYIPMSIVWELEEWNDGWIADGEEDKCIELEQINVYKFNKEKLYSICLGYYPIDLSLFESDIVPELIGTILELTEDFCYVSSCEDDNNVYIYSAVELDEDDIFEIEERLFDLMNMIVPEQKYQYEALDTYYMDAGGYCDDN